ncbi:ATP-binding protein [Gemmatimonas groenlandica]|uniref:histidine kinase n=1 Tax=Gemmatimonas groenlandica TaxID=2732249 RepID=A0A6M4ISB4_9BACT|nr:ATP-binding protein [Gemmatimonas groenlandica]QJR36958.1 HAMP domain-containing protein [Gemmatimonas groenlandica]
MRLSIRMRLTLWNASVLAFVLGAFALAGWITLTTTLRQRTDAAVRESARVVAGAIRAERAAAQARGDVEEVRGETEQAVLRELRVGDLEVFIADEGAQLMAARQPGPSRTSINTIDDAVLLPDEVRTLLRDIVQTRATEIADERQVAVGTIHMRGVDWRAGVTRLAPMVQDPGEPPLLVTALHSLEDDRLLLRAVRTTLLLAIPLALLASVIAGYALARRSLAPLDAITTRTASITAANLDDRLQVVNPHDELGRLAHIVNGLLGRVGDAFRTQRQFVADASHELRTPIAIIRGEADVTLRRSTRDETEYREALQVIQQESVRLSRVVDDLFLLARVDAGSPIGEYREVAIAELVATAARSVRSLAESRSVSLQLSESPATAELRIHGDSVLLHRLVLNLLDNALKHAPASSTVYVRVDATDQLVQIDVDDEGPGVPSALRDRLFERFVHGASSQPDDDASGHGGGAGLGLAIAQAIAHAHGGHIGLRPSTDRAHGACFRVTLPRSASASGDVA